MRIKQLTIFALSAITLVSSLSTSCKKSNSSDPPNPYKNNSLNATVNGASFTITGGNAEGYHDTVQHLWRIGGLRTTDSAALSLFIYDTFTVNQPVTTPKSALEYVPSAKAGYYNYVGVCNTTITVTSLDTANRIITGTFGGNLTGNGILYFGKAVTDTTVVTHGNFSVYYNL